MSARRREAAHSLGAGRRLSHSTCFLLPSDGGVAETLHSLPLTDSSSRVCLLFLFSQPCHLSPSLTPACHFHFFFSSSLTPSSFPPVCALPPSLTLHSLVISLTVHALSTVKADCNQQRHTQTHTDKKLAAADNVLHFLPAPSPPCSFSH